MDNQTNYSEAKIQQLAITEIRNKYPETYGLFWHCPNGGVRDHKTASILVGQGVVPGVQDLHFIWQGRLHLIEVKNSTGHVDPAQKFIHAKHDFHGIKTYIFKTSYDIVSYVEAVIFGRDLSVFDRFISPFSDKNKVEIYQKEYRELRIKQKTRNSA